MSIDSTDHTLYQCRECGEDSALCEIHESSCGGYEDYKYHCTNEKCLATWWIDGIDS